MRQHYCSDLSESAVFADLRENTSECGIEVVRVLFDPGHFSVLLLLRQPLLRCTKPTDCALKVEAFLLPETLVFGM